MSRSKKRHNEPGIVLSTRALGDADIIFSLLGDKSGKLSAVAKGARGSKKRFFNSVDVFDCGVFELTQTPRSNLYYLEGITSKQSFPGIRNDLTAFAVGSLCLEVTERFSVEEDPEGSTLFRPLFRSLKALQKGIEINRAYAIAAFYCLRVLHLGGFSFLDSKTPAPEQVRRWFDEMLRQNNPTVPEEDRLSIDGLRILVKFMEQILGTALRTSSAIAK